MAEPISAGEKTKMVGMAESILKHLGHDKSSETKPSDWTFKDKHTDDLLTKASSTDLALF